MLFCHCWNPWCVYFFNTNSDIPEKCGKTERNSEKGNKYENKYTVISL